MKKCPRCGHDLDVDTGVCWECGYRKREKHDTCPECGEPMVRGVCYRCGHRGGKANNTCPYCHQKLIKGYCQTCDYKAGEGKLFGTIVLIIIICLVMSWII